MVNFATFDLNLLRVLDALLRDRSTIKAGERLGLSQPAVSAALGRLRHALNDDILVRQGQRMVPTDFANRLTGPLREELFRLETLFVEPAFEPETANMTFRVCGSDFFADMLMPALIERTQEISPFIKIQLVDLVPDSYVDTLDRYGADAALVPDADFPDWIEKQVLFRSPFVVIAANDNPHTKAAKLKAGDTFPLDLFCELKHALFSPQGNIRSMGDDALDEIGRQRDVVATLPAFSGVCRTVRNSDLIALVPCQYAQNLGGLLNIQAYKAPIDVVVPKISLIWQRRLDNAPSQVWFRELVSSILSPLETDAESWL